MLAEEWNSTFQKSSELGNIFSFNQMIFRELSTDDGSANA